MRCRHCWLQPKYEAGHPKHPVLDFDLFQEILDQAEPLGLSSVKLTGGEPLLHPDIERILNELKSRDLKISIESNGVLCSQKLSAIIASFNRMNISISLDGANEETHDWIRGVEGSFDSAMRGIDNLVREGVKPQLIMTIMKYNVDQMEDLVKLAERKGAGSVKFNIVQPTARGEKLHDDGAALEISELVKYGSWVEKDLAKQANISVFFSHPVAFRPLSKIFSNSNGAGVCGIKGIIGVLANGKYALCGIGEMIPDLVFGDALTDDLKTVWQNDPVINTIRWELPAKLDGICSQCLMNSVCLGTCIAQNYYRNSNLWESYWYCEQARNAGLFPESRLIPVSESSKSSSSI